MKFNKFVVLIAGILGITAFFLPLVAVNTQGITGKLSAYRIVAGIDTAKQVVSTTAEASKEDIAKANESLSAIKTIVLGVFAPVGLLLLIGFIGVARRKFGRLAGTFSFLLGAIGLGVASILLSAAEGKDAGGAAGGVAGSGLYVMFAAGALGLLAGLLTLFKPDRGTA